MSGGGGAHFMASGLFGARLGSCIIEAALVGAEYSYIDVRSRVHNNSLYSNWRGFNIVFRALHGSGHVTV
jgi:hypothetical protein